MLTASCATPIQKSEAPPKPVIVAPSLDRYSEEFETKLADELEQLAPPCPRDYIVPNCSALYRITLDGIHLRNRVKELTTNGG